MYLQCLLKSLSPLSLFLDFKVMELSSVFAQNDLMWLKGYSGQDSTASYIGPHILLWLVLPI